MKKVLCFGDSNTFGFNPENGLRYSKKERWTGILQDLCKDSFEIIEAGCNNRTCFRNNPNGKFFTGIQILPEYLKQCPDIIIIGLGANDLQRQYRTSIEEIQYGLETLIDIARKELPNIKIILLSPSIIGEQVLSSKIFSFLFDKSSIDKSKELSSIYLKVAKLNNCDFIDLAKIAKVSEIDGLHYSPETHKLIAHTIYKHITTN